MLNYLRSERKYLPRQLSSDKKHHLKMEIQFWQVDKGLEKMNQLSHPVAENIKNMFKYVPKISINKSQKSLENFKKL